MRNAVPPGGLLCGEVERVIPLVASKETPPACDECDTALTLTEGLKTLHADVLRLLDK